MEDDQRAAMFDAWRKTKKLANVSVRPLNRKLIDGETWVATALSQEEGVFSYNTVGTTKLEAIQRMQTLLVSRGYEINNMPELMGITPPDSTPYMSVEESMKHTLPKQQPKKRTFLEWLKEIEYRNRKYKMDYQKEIMLSKGVWIN